MTIWLATTNAHKIKEIQSFFKSFENLQFQSPKNLKEYTPPEETGISFKENAEIKASHFFYLLKKQLLWSKDALVLGEDSGIEVQALNGEPGIYSARYSGKDANDSKNNKLLLDKMNGKQDRAAQYVCAICAINDSGDKSYFQGVCRGSIALKERGKNGFGYDPLFIPKGESQSFGELTKEFKESVSHRSQALEKFKDFVKNQRILKENI